ncbi:MAG: 6-phosphogluconolactonase [Deltaproteobacteria bacterium HGW-Deltaproteobacteria-21]|nr:MAG: 6-phosphogluconolactonase [Deltaproteobacteria bacterium HGW-Deltaproteobacteria-21]
MFRPKVRIYPTCEDLSVALAGHVALIAAQATEKRNSFTVALSGGSVMEILGPQLAARPLCAEIDWSAWHVFWADERCVAFTSPESNYGTANRLLFSDVDIPSHQIHALDDTLGAVAAAEAYESILKRAFRPKDSCFPRFDLVLLGIGEDGHIASLFPGSPLLGETARWVLPVFNAPKPPAVRVTLTLPVINNARHVLFVAAGSGKKGVLSEVLRHSHDRPGLPAELVRPIDGDLQWFVDEAAAGEPAETTGLHRPNTKGGGSII